MSGSTKQIRFKADSAQEGQRVDRAIMKHVEGISRSRVQRCIDDGLLTVNARPVKSSHRLRCGDEVVLNIPPEAPLAVTPQDLPLDILFQDSWFLVVNKPAGMVVHPGAGIREGTLANALVHHFGTLPGTADLRPGIVHRLDRDTSGLLIVTLTEESRNRFSAMFRRRHLYKEYAALVYGGMDGDYGTIDSPIGRHPVHRLKMTTRAPRSRPCLTEWFVEREYAGFTLLRVVLHTGRTHQIRVHLASRGHPIVGDSLYGGKRHLQIRTVAVRRAIEGQDRFFLHARRLRFEHPFTGEEMVFEAALPAELGRLLDVIENEGRM